MRIKHNISFRCYSYVADGGNRYQIRLVTTFNGERIELSTGIRFSDSGSWDDTMGQFKAGISGSDIKTAAELNRELNRQAAEMEDVFKYFEVTEKKPTAADVRQYYRKKSSRDNQVTGKEKNNTSRNQTDKTTCPVSKKTLTHVFADFCNECGIKNSWTRATHQKMESLLRDLETFRPGLKCTDFDESTLTAFVEYLRTAKVLHTPRKAKEKRNPDSTDDTIGLRNSSIFKKLGFLKWFLKWADNKGYSVNNAYKSFSPTLKQTQKKVIYLTQDELQRVIVYDIDKCRHLEPVRDIFLFCCFSGLRYSDANNLRWDDVKNDRIEVTTIKTADSIKIELNDMTASLLEKYRKLSLYGDYVLPRLTNQAMNRDLKELCRLCGINERILIVNYRGSERLEETKEKWELVGTHTGRRTFVVQALSRGISPNIVMKWTGHSDYKAMKPYIDIIDSVKASEMNKMNFLDKGV